MKPVAVIGAGLAGCEASLVLARRGIGVRLYEMRPVRMTPAHTTDLPAELVCSNSLKTDILPSAHGLLKKELELLGSPLLDSARQTRIPAGSALAVDRRAFSAAVLAQIEAQPRIELVRGEMTRPPDECCACIIAAGPLVSDALASWLIAEFGAPALRFYDAIAPIVAADSIDRSIAFSASRWDDGPGDYLNCPFTREEYGRFLTELRAADCVRAHAFEDARFFEGCLPIEVMAGRGERALAFGPMRPVGLIDPRTGRQPYAVCQLRSENAAKESYNMVGFQTRLTIAAQRRVFRVIPGLSRAEFLRYGSIHRNAYLDSPRLLNERLGFVARPGLFLAGQLCGNEGYAESIATGHCAAIFVWASLAGRDIPPPPAESALGALLRHVTKSAEQPFAPSGMHFGLLPPLPQFAGKRRPAKTEKRWQLCNRALEALHQWRQLLD